MKYHSHIYHRFVRISDIFKPLHENAINCTIVTTILHRYYGASSFPCEFWEPWVVRNGKTESSGPVDPAMVVGEETESAPRPWAVAVPPSGCAPRPERAPSAPPRVLTWSCGTRTWPELLNRSRKCVVSSSEGLVFFLLIFVIEIGYCSYIDDRSFNWCFVRNIYLDLKFFAISFLFRNLF